MKRIFAYLLLLTSPLLYAETASLNNDAVKPLVDNIVQSYQQANQPPGIAIAIYYQGNDYFYFYGVANKKTNQPITPDTIFELASISKVFTTTMLSLEVQAGNVQLNDPVTKYFTKLVATSNLPIDQVTLLDLATHTASFPRDITQFNVRKGDVNGLMRNLKTWQAPYAVGSQYSYSNIGFGVLGMAVANAANTTFGNLLAKEITQPLNMTHTVVTIPLDQAQGYNLAGEPVPPYVPRNFEGGGAVRSSPADMLIFLKANLGIANNAPPSLLSAMQFAQKPRFMVKPNFVMGLGWQRQFRNGHLFITKNGSDNGFSTFIGFAPKQQFGVVVLINQNKAKAVQLGNQLLNALAAP